MEFLNRHSVIHGDLAARNILLHTIENIKITDFGKAHRINYDNLAVPVQGHQPILWMPVDAIQNREVSLLSDVWSFGITVWEVFSLGQEPYNGSTNSSFVWDFTFKIKIYFILLFLEFSYQEYFENLQDGYRLGKPDLCPSQIYRLMTECWRTVPQVRLGMLNPINPRGGGSLPCTVIELVHIK